MLSAEAGLYDTWNNRVKLSFTNQPSGPLTNFPVLITLSTNVPGFRYADFTNAATGGDLRFADANGMTALNYEIEKWDTNAASYVWVQVPLLSSSNDFIYAYWGKDITAAPCTTNGAVWTDGYAAVWHLGDSVSPALDSTANNNIGAFNKWWTGSMLASNEWQLETTVGGSDNIPAFNVMIGTNKYSAADTAAITTGQWYPITGVRSGTNLFLYLNGQQRAKTSGVTGAVNNVGRDLYLGYFPQTPTLSPRAQIDEARVSLVARSSNWVYACYQNQKSNSTFVAYGTTARIELSALPPSNIGATSVRMNVRVDWFGSVEAPSVYFCWDDADKGIFGGTSAWGHVNFVGASWSEGQSFSNDVTILLSGSNYSYRCYATNSASEIWSGPQALRTIALASVTNTGAVVLGPSTVSLRGTVLDTGGELPNVSFL